MKYSIIKRISETEIARVTVSLADDCNNGSDDFSYACDIFDLRGNRTEVGIKFEGRTYRESSSDKSRELMLKHFAELEPIYILSGCDAKGVPLYPLMNGAHFLEREPEYVMTEFRITKAEADMLKHYKPLSLAKFWYNLTETRYKDEVKKAVKLLEKLTGEKYKPSTNVSPHLYNDLHFVLITEKEGWNIHKGEKDKKNLKYHLDLSK